MLAASATCARELLLRLEESQETRDVEREGGLDLRAHADAVEEPVSQIHSQRFGQRVPQVTPPGLVEKRPE
jgi:hypothetical protein